MTRATTTPVDPVRALKGATSYWACVVANSSGHMSHHGAHGTDMTTVTLGRSAHLVSLHQGRPGIADGTGCEAASGMRLERQGGSRVMEGAVPLRPHLRTSTTRSVKGSPLIPAGPRLSVTRDMSGFLRNSYCS